MERSTTAPLAAWLRLATERATLGRALVTSLVVGALLDFVNRPLSALTTGLTFAVPFAVSLLSSVVANRSRVAAEAAHGVTEQRRVAAQQFPDRNPNPVLRIEPDGHLGYANTASAGLLAAWGIAVGDALPDGMLAELRAAAATDPPPMVEVPSGIRTFAILPIADPGEPGRLQLYGTDITDRKVIARFPDQNPNPVLRMSEDGRLLYANEAAARITAALGPRPGEPLRPGDPLPPDMVARIRSVLSGESAEATPGDIEIQGDGHAYVLRPVDIPESGFVNLYGIDITARQAMNKFPDQNPNPVMRVTRDGILRYANPASALCRKALGAEVGHAVPEAFMARVLAGLDNAGPTTIELQSEGRIFEVLAISVYEFDFINLYGTDVTAARQIEAANRENERLLLNILPASIAQRLKDGELTIADRIDEMTVLFADVVGFTELSSRLSASEVVDLLNRVFSVFDRLVDRYDLEKIKTIGDAYMVVGGLAPGSEPDATGRVAQMALDMIDEVAQIRTSDGRAIEVRVGLHSGPAVAGVIGLKKFIYDVWGDTVNTASRMESHGFPSRIQVTDTTKARLGDRFVFERRGYVDVKGKGPIDTYFLVGRSPDGHPDHVEHAMPDASDKPPDSGLDDAVGCSHLDMIHPVEPDADGCSDCLAIGDRWVHLRICLTCGHVGCCNDSKNRHAMAHFRSAGHPIMQSFEPGENWRWCWIDGVDV